MAKKSVKTTEAKLRLEIQELRSRLSEAEETLDAIRNGEVDAVFVSGIDGEKVFSLTSAETPYRIFIEQMNEGAATLAADGTILYCNQQFSELISVPFEKAIGVNFIQLVPEIGKPEFDSLLEAGMKENCKCVARLSTSNGEEAYLNLSFSPLPSTVLGDVCLLVSEITELKKKEAELKRASDVLEQRVAERTAELKDEIAERKRAENELRLKNEELQKANAEKDKFFSIIAHDLRNPFNSLLGFTKLLEEELPMMTQQETLKIAGHMRKSATNLFRLLENLLEWSRMQHGLIPFTPEKIQLNEVVESIMPIALEPATKKKIEIFFSIPSDIYVLADGNMLQSVIRNLLSNAVKFTHQGGRVNVSAKTIGHDFVELSITDTGIGMSSSMVDNLFRLDVQTNRTGTEGEPTSGLGLIIMKDFIEKHGGNIRVESKEGEGSTFYVTLPNHKEGIR